MVCCAPGVPMLWLGEPRCEPGVEGFRTGVLLAGHQGQSREWLPGTLLSQHFIVRHSTSEWPSCYNVWDGIWGILYLIHLRLCLEGSSWPVLCQAEKVAAQLPSVCFVGLGLPRGRAMLHVASPCPRTPSI